MASGTEATNGKKPTMSARFQKTIVERIASADLALAHEGERARHKARAPPL
jgi:hypothetical protein